MEHKEITGSLYERNGKYTAVLNLYDASGKRKQKSIALGIPVKGNKRKAQARLEELKREYSSGAATPTRRQTESPLFADFLRDWLKITAPTIERTTYSSYESMIDARLDSFFRERKLRLCDVEPRHIRELHESIFKDSCNANTVIHYHAVVERPRQTLDSEALSAFFLERWADFPDMLTAPQAASLCGYGTSAINRWIKDGTVNGVCYRGKNLISKESLAVYLASQEGQLTPVLSMHYKELLEEFQAGEQTSDMEWGSMSL